MNEQKKSGFATLIGRPNVGKSTLFNVLAGERISIVKDTPGITRDRIYADAEWLNRKFTLVDTGGIEPYSDDVILSQMRRQAQLAIDSADVIVLVTDLQTGVTATDQEVAAMLQKSGKPIVLCVNKCDRLGGTAAGVLRVFTTSGSATRSRYLRPTDMGPGTCSTPAMNRSTLTSRKMRRMRSSGSR